MNSRHLRLAPLALAAVLVLGACGSDDPTADGSVPAVSDGSDTGDMMAPRPVHTSGGTGAGGTAMSASAEAAPASDRMSSDMMAPYRIATFVAGDGLPALPTDDVGYLFEAGATVTAEQVAELASALGVTGEPERIDDGYSVYWRVGPDDGTAPSVTVYQDAQLSWNYSTAWATAQVMSGCAVAEPAIGVDPAGSGATDAVAPLDTAVVDGCVEPRPPANVPTAAEAETKARDLMVALGLDPATFTLEPYADEWSASISAVEQIDGSIPGRRVDITYGAEGALQYAGGQLAQPVAVGPYDLIDLDAALARLNDPSGFYTGYGSVGLDRTMMDTAVASDVAVAPAAEPAVVEPSSGVSEGSGGSSGSGAAPAPMPVESVPVGTVVPPTLPAPETPVEVVVTLVDVAADVWWTWDVDGSVWLLPAYRFTGDDGGTYVVPAVTDEFLVQEPVEVPVPEPMPVETAPGEPPATTANFVTTDFDDLVGLPLDQFTEEAKARGAETRVVLQDGESLAVTADFSPSRVNVEANTVDGVLTVVSVTSIG